MSETTKSKKVEVKEEIVKVQIVKGNEISNAIQNGNIGDMLKNATKSGYSLTSVYLEMELGEVDRFVVMQESTVTVEDANTKLPKEIPTILMVNSNGTTVQGSHTVLVNAAKKVLGKMIEVECLGKPKGKNYVDYSVTALN